MMVSKKSITIGVASFLIFGFIFLALPQSGHAEIEPGCCQYGIESGVRSCLDTSGPCPKPLEPTSFDGFFADEVCNEETGFCSNFNQDVPTLSEWVLIAMAGVLGIVGFIFIRRRTASAGV